MTRGSFISDLIQELRVYVLDFGISENEKKGKKKDFGENKKGKKKKERENLSE